MILPSSTLAFLCDTNRFKLKTHKVQEGFTFGLRWKAFAAAKAACLWHYSCTLYWKWISFSKPSYLKYVFRSNSHVGAGSNLIAAEISFKLKTQKVQEGFTFGLRWKAFAATKAACLWHYSWTLYWKQISFSKACVLW